MKRSTFLVRLSAAVQKQSIIRRYLFLSDIVPHWSQNMNLIVVWLNDLHTKTPSRPCRWLFKVSLLFLFFFRVCDFLPVPLWNGTLRPPKDWCYASSPWWAGCSLFCDLLCRCAVWDSGFRPRILRPLQWCGIQSVADTDLWPLITR